MTWRRGLPSRTITRSSSRQCPSMCDSGVRPLAKFLQRPNRCSARLWCLHQVVRLLPDSVVLCQGSNAAELVLRLKATNLNVASVWFFVVIYLAVCPDLRQVPDWSALRWEACSERSSPLCHMTCKPREWYGVWPLVCPRSARHGSPQHLVPG